MKLIVLLGIEQRCMDKDGYQPKGDCNMAQDLKYHSMVRMYRIQSGLRQEDLAREIDVSRRTVDELFVPEENVG